MPKKHLKELGRTELFKVEKEAREYAQEIIATVREPLLVMDMDLRVILANKSFYQAFKVDPRETIGQYRLFQS